jgi:hypothetical protein
VADESENSGKRNPEQQKSGHVPGGPKAAVQGRPRRRALRIQFRQPAEFEQDVMGGLAALFRRVPIAMSYRLSEHF